MFVKLNREQYDGMWRPFFSIRPRFTIDGYLVVCCRVWRRWDYCHVAFECSSWEYRLFPPTAEDDAS